MFEAILPMPPTANHLFPTFIQGGKPRRYKSKDYEAWIERASIELRSQNTWKQPIKGRLAVTYRFAFGTNRKTDLPNFEKAVSDLLVSQGVIEDDSQIDVMELRRMPKNTRPVVYITVREIDPLALFSSGGGGE